LAAACSATPAGNSPGSSDASSAGGSNGGGKSSESSLLPFDAGSSISSSSLDAPNAIDAAPAKWPPDGYINATESSIGAYALGPELTGSEKSTTTTATGQCTGMLFGVVRDFKMGTNTGGHPDFETPEPGDDKGIVKEELGPDGKPVYASSTKTFSTNGKANFDQWYNDVDGVSRSFVLALQMVQEGKISTFSATKPGYFFPLDGQGFGNEGQDHNFSFTTEIHTSFRYAGGETFSFAGDDDVWVFINKQLVIDLGGRHGEETAKVSIDDLGLEVGQVYDLAVFHAERHTSESNFQIQTSMRFEDCGQVNGIVY
jgi:fibro-slime domain-containing protein